MCCGTDHMPIVFQGFLYSQTFTFQTPCLHIWELCPCPALPLLRCLQGMGSGQQGAWADLGTSFPWGAWMDYSFWFKMKQWPLVKAQVWARSRQHWRSEQTRFWRSSSSPLCSPLDYLSATLKFFLSLKKTTHTSKRNQTNIPFPKSFEISQLKAEWEPDIPSGTLFPTPSHLQRKFKNPFPEKLSQQQPTSSFVTTELKWGKSCPEFFISLNINIIWE